MRVDRNFIFPAGCPARTAGEALSHLNPVTFLLTVLMELAVTVTVWAL